MRYRKYNPLHLPILSFFSKRLYRDVGYNWKGINMVYLFLLLAICCIPPTLSLRDDMTRSIETNHMVLINQLPDIRITDGVVSADAEQPYIIEQDGSPIAIIDTTGSMNYIDDASVKALLTETQLILRRGDNEFNKVDLSQVTDFHINKEIATHWMETARNSLAPLSYAIFLLLSYVFTVMLMLLTAVIGLILSALIHSSLNFAGVMRVAAAAITPTVILIAVTTSLGYPLPGFIYGIITGLYLLIGLIACRQKPPEEVLPSVQLTSLLHEDAEQEHQSNAA